MLQRLIQRRLKIRAAGKLLGVQKDLPQRPVPFPFPRLIDPGDPVTLQGALQHFGDPVVFLTVAIAYKGAIIGGGDHTPGRRKRTLDPFQLLHHLPGAEITLRPVCLQRFIQYTVHRRRHTGRACDPVRPALVEISPIGHQLQCLTPYLLSRHHAQQQVARGI